MIDRIPPHNAEAERSALGAAMLDKNILSDILEEVKEEDFYNENHVQFGTYTEKIHRSMSSRYVKN